MSPMEWVAYYLIGLLVGVATLPWANKILDADRLGGPLVYVLLVAFYWPYLALMGAINAAAWYRAQWRKAR